MKRRYPKTPVVGIGAIILRRGRVLLIERARPPAEGQWSLPGGVLEPGERLADAVRREVLEETGLRVKPERVFEVAESIIRDRRGRLEYHYVLIDFLCRVDGGRLCASSDAVRAEWVAEAELDRLPMTEGTLEVIRRAFRASRRRRQAR